MKRYNFLSKVFQYNQVIEYKFDTDTYTETIALTGDKERDLKELKFNIIGKFLGVPLTESGDVILDFEKYNTSREAIKMNFKNFTLHAIQKKEDLGYKRITSEDIDYDIRTGDTVLYKDKEYLVKYRYNLNERCHDLILVGLEGRIEDRTTKKYANELIDKLRDTVFKITEKVL